MVERCLFAIYGLSCRRLGFSSLAVVLHILPYTKGSHTRNFAWHPFSVSTLPL